MVTDVPADVLIEASRLGYSEWARVMYEPMAHDMCARLKAEQPRTDPSVALLPDDSWIIWYKPGEATWNR